MKARIAAIVGVVVLTSHGEVAAQEKSPLDRITESAAGSTCASFNWANRGLAPKAYIRGIALSFAKAACQPERADVKVVSAAANAADANSDALSWYDQIFRANGMANDKGGLETLRHAYVLLIGLGMRESSGKHCVGRDMSANFSTADSLKPDCFRLLGARTNIIRRCPNCSTATTPIRRNACWTPIANVSAVPPPTPRIGAKAKAPHGRN